MKPRLIWERKVGALHELEGDLADVAKVITTAVSEGWIHISISKDSYTLGRHRRETEEEMRLRLREVEESKEQRRRLYLKLKEEFGDE